MLMNDIIFRPTSFQNSIRLKVVFIFNSLSSAENLSIIWYSSRFGSISICTGFETSTVGEGILDTLFVKTQLSIDLKKLVSLS
jgi:hypothetical protein